MRTTAAEVLATGAGVCQDFAHLSLVAERHVRVAAGRDYTDVSPFRGIYAGLTTQHLDVTVELIRKA